MITIVVIVSLVMLNALFVAPWMFLIGMLIAGVSSFLSLRRYLKV